MGHCDGCGSEIEVEDIICDGCATDDDERYDDQWALLQSFRDSMSVG